MFSVKVVIAQSEVGDDNEVRQEAEKLFSEGKYIEAFPKYSQLLSLHQKDPFYTFRFGVCLMYFDTRETSKPIEYIRKTKDKLTGNDALVYYYFLGIALQQDYRFGEATASFSEFLQKAGSKHIFFSDATQRKKMCESGASLLKKMQSLSVLDKKQTSLSTFFRSYALKGMGRNITLRPDFVSSKLDKKMEIPSLVYFSDTNKVLYFSSYGKKGTRGLDIYRTFKKEDGTWSSAEILGEEINTPYDENFPFITADGRNLYFCSKGHNSMGGYDIFRSSFDTVSKKWSAPENLDFPINSPFDDIMFVRDQSARFAIFSSNRNSKYGQLFVFTVRIDKKFAFDEKYKMEMLDIGSIEGGSDYDSLISKIKSASLMDINAGDLDYADTLDTPVLRVSQKDRDRYKIPENPSEKQIVDLAFEQVGKAENELGNFRNKRDAMQKYAELMRQKSKMINEEAAAYFDKASYETDSKKKQELYAKATQKSAESEKMAQESNFANKMFSALDSVAELQKLELSRLQDRAGRVQQIAGQRQLDSSIVLLKKLIDDVDSFGIQLAHEESKALVKQSYLNELQTEQAQLKSEVQNHERSISDLEEQSKQYKNEAALAKNPELKKEYLAEAALIDNNINSEKQKLSSVRSNISKLERKTAELQKYQQSYLSINEGFDNFLKNPENNFSTSNLLSSDTNNTSSNLSASNNQNSTVNNSSSSVVDNGGSVNANQNSASGKDSLLVNHSIANHSSENNVSDISNTNNSQWQKQKSDSLSSWINNLQAMEKENALESAYFFELQKQKIDQYKKLEIRKDDNIQERDRSLIELGRQLEVLEQKMDFLKRKEDSIKKWELEVQVLQSRKDLWQTLEVETRQTQMLSKWDSVKVLDQKWYPSKIDEVEKAMSDLKAKNEELEKSKLDYSKEYSLLSKQSGKGNSKKQAENERKKEELSQRIAELESEKVNATKSLDSLRKQKERCQQNIDFSTSLSDGFTAVSSSDKEKYYDSYRKLGDAKKQALIKESRDAIEKSNAMMWQEKSASALANNQTLDTLNTSKQTNLQGNTPNGSENGNSDIGQNTNKLLGDHNSQGTRPSDSLPQTTGVATLMLASKNSTQIKPQKLSESKRLIQQAAYYRQAAEISAIRLSTIKKVAAMESRPLSQDELRELEALEQLTKAYIAESKNLESFAENQSKLRNEALPSVDSTFNAKSFADFQMDESRQLFRKADSLKQIATQTSDTIKRNNLLKEIEKTEELAWIRYFSAYDIYGAYTNSIFEASASSIAIAKVLKDDQLSNVNSLDSLNAVRSMSEARALRSKAFKTVDNKQKAYYLEQAYRFEMESIALMQKRSGGEEIVLKRHSDYLEMYSESGGGSLDAMVLAVSSGTEKQSRATFYTTSQKSTTNNSNNVNNTNAEVVLKAGDPVIQGDKNLVNNENAIKNSTNVQVRDDVKQNSNTNTIIAVTGVDSDRSYYSAEHPIAINENIGQELFYRVQFAASREPVADDKYKGLSPIVAERSDGWVRYMVGYFSLFSEAIPARGAVREKGFADAFIVAYYKGKRISVFEARKIEADKRNRTTENTQVVSQSETQSQGSGIINTSVDELKGLTYSIQIGVYGKPRNSNRLFGISPLFEERMTNGYYRYYAGSFSEMKTALVERDRVRALGVPDAFIVILYNGKKISQAEADVLMQKGIRPQSVAAGDQSQSKPKAEKPVFKIQIGAYSKDVPIDVVNAMIDLSGNTIERMNGENNTTIYLSGQFEQYEEAKLRKEELVSKGLKDAFVVAFSEGKKMNLNEAIEWSKQK